MSARTAGVASEKAQPGGPSDRAAFVQSSVHTTSTATRSSRPDRCFHGQWFGTDRARGPKAPLADCITPKYTLCILGSSPAISPDCGWCICACVSRRQVVRYRRIDPIEHTTRAHLTCQSTVFDIRAPPFNGPGSAPNRAQGLERSLTEGWPKEERGSPDLGEVSWVTCAGWVNGGREEPFGAFDDAVFGSTEATRHVEASA